MTAPEAKKGNAALETATPSKAVTESNQVSKKSWRDWLPVHPAADRLELLPQKQLQELADDIRKNGLREPCAYREVNGGRELLDGRNRLDALELAGKNIREIFDHDIRNNNSSYFTKVPDDVDPVDYIISKNICRRHLTPEDREKRLIELVAMRPEESDRKLAQKAGVDHKTVAKARLKAEQLGKAPQLRTRVGRDNRRRTATPARAAKAAATSIGLGDKLPVPDAEPEPVGYPAGYESPWQAPSPAAPSPAASGPSTSRARASQTPALLKGQEGLVIDQQLVAVKNSIERLIGYARSCNKVPEIINALRDHLDFLEGVDAKVSRVRTGGAT
jgi:hypothetical protein